MKANDSRECRNCHEFESMDFVKQGRRGHKEHEEGFASGLTCIDCHKGVAHELPDMSEEDSSAVLSSN